MPRDLRPRRLQGLQRHLRPPRRRLPPHPPRHRPARPSTVAARAYRMGGDEFCVLASPERRRRRLVLADVAEALSERGDGFTITCSYGRVVLPAEAAAAEHALHVADQRMYLQKNGGRVSAGRQSSDVLLRALVGAPSLARGSRPRRGGAGGLDRRAARPAPRGARGPAPGGASSTTWARSPSPTRSSTSRVRWTTPSGSSCAATRSSASASCRLRPRSSASRGSCARPTSAWTARATPTGCAGEAIPLAARIVLVCDAYEAMTADRSYRKAMSDEVAIEELERCAGAQFDPRVVTAFRALADQRAPRGRLSLSSRRGRRRRRSRRPPAASARPSPAGGTR